MSTDEPKEKRKTELLRLIDGVEEKAPALEAFGQAIIERARFSRDIAPHIREVVRTVPNDMYLTAPVWDRVESDLRDWNRRAAGILRGFRTGISSFGTSGGTAFTAFVGPTGAAVQSILAFDLAIDHRSAIEKAASRASDVIDNSALFGAVRAAMMRLGISQPHSASIRGPIEHLEDAKAGLTRPTTENVGPVPVLISLRQGIETTLAMLLQRRPYQETAKKASDKLRSIGSQCARPGLQEDHFRRLGLDADALLDRLSSAKDKNFSRADVMDQYRQSLLLLLTLLEGLDETRLRR